MRIVQPSSSQLTSAVGLAVPARTSPSTGDLQADVDSGRIRPEWSVVAIDESDAIVGRAIWWGRDSSAPIALEAWDVAPQVPDRAGLAAALLEAGHDAMSSLGAVAPLPHTLRVPTDWRDDAAVVAEVDLKTGAAAAAGLTLVNERLQFQRDSGGVLPPAPAELAFAPASDEDFVELFAAAAEGSLDVMTRRELESVSPEELARAEVDYYLACPGDRSWWRTAATTDGTVVGIAIPSATPTNVNVGYLAVLPQHRGHGYVDEILAFITRFHAERGTQRITATTDAVNSPMAAAFRRSGYRCTETRIDLETP